MRQSNEELSSFMNFSSLVWLCQKVEFISEWVYYYHHLWMLKDVVFGNIMFLCVILASRFCLNTSAVVSRQISAFLLICIFAFRYLWGQQQYPVPTFDFYQLYLWVLLWVWKFLVSLGITELRMLDHVCDDDKKGSHHDLVLIF